MQFLKTLGVPLRLDRFALPAVELRELEMRRGRNFTAVVDANCGEPGLFGLRCPIHHAVGLRQIEQRLDHLGSQAVGPLEFGQGLAAAPFPQ